MNGPFQEWVFPFVKFAIETNGVGGSLGAKDNMDGALGDGATNSYSRSKS